MQFVGVERVEYSSLFYYFLVLSVRIGYFTMLPFGLLFYRVALWFPYLQMRNKNTLFPELLQVIKEKIYVQHLPQCLGKCDQ